MRFPFTLSAAKTIQADAILKASVVLVSVLVLALAAVLTSEASLNARTLESISISRAIRDDMVVLSQALARAEALRADPDRFAAASAQARAKLENMHAVSETVPAANAEAAVMRVIAEDFLSGRRHPADAFAALAQSSERMRELINARNDEARQRENAARFRLASVAGALALLALAASALAMLALNRERRRWREASDLAEEARAKAAASDLAKTRFLAVASHDMRQPLHALTLYVSALERRVEGDEARDILAKMERATRSMTGMFSTLLDLARVQAGVVTPEVVEFPLEEVLHRIAAQNPTGVEAPDTNIMLRSDPVLLEGALRNLVSNALRHGGGAARIELTPLGEHVEIAVIDDGPGIAAEDQQRIFDEFVRLDARAGAEGLGLGLAIVKRMSALLDMPLSLRSAPGQGARFALRAPIAGRAAHAAAESMHASLAGAAVLVVDDDPLAREAAAGALRDQGAQVRAAHDEASARVVLASGFQPDLLVMDLRIDGRLEGVEIARRLVKPLARAPRTIIVTGDTAPETLQMLRASGLQWLIKPVDPQDLNRAAAPT